MWGPYFFLDGLVLDNIRWSRSERKSCFPTFRASSTFSRDRNKHGRINCLSVHATNEGKHSSINHIAKAERKHPLKKLIDRLLFISRDLTQEEGWKTQDGIMTKKRTKMTSKTSETTIFVRFHFTLSYLMLTFSTGPCSIFPSWK